MKKPNGKLHWVPAWSDKIDRSTPRAKTACGIALASKPRCASSDRQFLVKEGRMGAGYIRRPGKDRCLKCWRASLVVGTHS